MADYFLTRAQQVAVELEGTKGTAETLVAADVALNPLTTDAPFLPEHDRRELEEASEDIGSALDEVGGSKGRIPFSCVLQTSGTLGTAPALADFLLGCGLKEQLVETITISAPTGGDSQFLAGETYSATGAKTGIIEQTITGAGTLRYIATAGGSLIATDVVTANTDTATASGDGAIYGVKYSPASASQQTVTIQRAEKNSEATAAQDYLYRLKGAMGNFQLNLRPGFTADFVSEFLGVVDLMGAGSMLTGYTIESNANRPKFVSSTVQLDGETLKVGDVTFDAGNDLQIDPDPSAAAGYVFSEVAGRAPTIAISPRRQKPTEFDDLLYMTTETSFAVVLTLGTVAGKIVRIEAPKAQIRAWSAEERVGRRAAALTLHLTRGTLLDTDYAIYFQ